MKKEVILALLVTLITWVNHYYNLNSIGAIYILIFYSIVLVILMLLCKHKRPALIIPIGYLMVECIFINIIGYNNIKLDTGVQTFISIVRDLMDFTGRMLPLYFLYTYFKQNFEINRKGGV